MRDLGGAKGKTLCFDQISFKKTRFTYFFLPYSHFSNNCFKVSFRILQSKFTHKETSVQMAVELGSESLKVSLYVGHRTSKNKANNRNIGYWLNLIKFIKEYIGWIDINRLRTDYIQIDHSSKGYKKPLKNQGNSMAEKKNDMIASLVLRIVSEGSVLSKNQLKGFSPVTDMNSSRLRKLKENLAVNFWIAKWLTNQYKTTITKLAWHEDQEPLLKEASIPEVRPFQLQEKDDSDTPANFLTVTKHLSYMSMEDIRPSPLLVLDFNLKKEKTDIKETIKRQDKFMRSYKQNRILYETANTEEVQKHHLVTFDEFSNFMEDNKASLLSFFGSKIMDMRKDQSKRKSPQYPVLHTLDSRLFTVVRRLGHRFVLLTVRLNLSSYFDPVSHLIVKGSQLDFAKEFPLECIVDLIHTRLTSSDLSTPATPDAKKFTVGDLLQGVHQPHILLYGILRQFLCSKMLGSIKKLLINEAQSNFSRLLVMQPST